MATAELSGWERTARAVEKVRERLSRFTRALDAAGISYAVTGGNAVAEWVGRVDDAAIRFTPDIDILIRPVDLPRIQTVAASVGFIHRNIENANLFIDGPDGRIRDAVHVLFANVKVRPEYLTVAPDISDSERGKTFQVLSLDSLVRMKLTSFRTKDRVHLLDMIDVGLLDASSPARFEPELAARLQTLLDNPDG
jgi:hypothetical protein